MNSPRFIKNIVVDQAEVKLHTAHGYEQGTLYLCDFHCNMYLIFETYSDSRILGENYKCWADATSDFDKLVKTNGILNNPALAKC